MPKHGLALAIALIAFAPAFGASPLEKIIPEDALFYVTVRDVNSLREKIKSYSFSDIPNEPSVQRFIDETRPSIDEKIQEMESRTGMSLDEIRSIVQGQVALFLNADEEGNPEWALLADVGESGAKIIQLLHTAQAVAEEEGEEAAVRRVEDDFEGTSLFKLYPQQAEDAPEEPEPDMTYAAADDLFILGSPVATVKRLISFHKDPPETSLESSPGYAYALERTSATPDVLVFANTRRIINLVSREVQGGGADAMLVASMLDALGLTGLASAGASLELGPDAATARIFVQNVGPPRGIVKAFMPTPGPLNAGDEIPADAAVFFTGRLDPAAIWDEIEFALVAIAPAQKAMIDQQLQRFGEQLGEPFDLRNDILAVFGPSIAYYERSQKPYDLRTSQHSLFIIDISSKAAFEAASTKIKKLWPGLLGMMEPRDYLGYQVFVQTIPVPPNMAPDAADRARPTPAYTVTESSLIIASRVEALEAHLRRLGKGEPSLADNTDLRQGISRQPTEGRVALAFIDPRPLVEMLITGLREGQLNRDIRGMGGVPGAAELLPQFDFSLLPNAAEVTKHLAPLTASAAVGGDGLSIILTVPARPNGE